MKKWRSKESVDPAWPAKGRNEYTYSLLQALLEVSPDGILVVSAEGAAASHNRQFLDIWRLPPPEKSRQRIGTSMGPDQPILQAVVERVADSVGFLKRVRELYADPRATDHCEIELKDGRTVERHSTGLWSRADVSLGRVWFFRDITGRRQMETRLRNSEQRFRAFAEAAQDAMIVMDSRGMVRYWNPAAQKTLGYSAEEALGMSIHQWLAPERFRQAAAAALNRLSSDGLGARAIDAREFAAIRKDGAEIPIELSIAPIQIDTEQCAIGILRDITHRKDTGQRLILLARTDALTGLPNRSAFVNELQSAIVRNRHGDKHLAVFFIDLDHFKDVNDTLGHPVGDQLLQSVAQRLQRTLRETDVIARFGGDEFAVLATRLSHPTDAGILAEKLLAAMVRPFSIAGHQVHSGATLGIAIQDSDTADAEGLLGHADVALYRAKAEGRGRFHIFTDAMHRDVRLRVELLAELREAIDQHQLSLMYQPQVHIDTRAIVGLEALVRWNHPQRGTIPPSEFIGAAENSGLIIVLGHEVLRMACRAARRWIDMGIEMPVMAVNVSPTQFKTTSKLTEDIANVLRDNRIRSDMLEIELTETTLMHASQHSSDVLQCLRELGVRIAIDDFGSGYSCLDYLRRFSVSRIKIAQSFVADIAGNQNSAAITRAAIGLGHELGLGVIAEGVETAEQARLLREWGCQEAQGYYFARPLSFDDATALLIREHVSFAK